MKQTKKSILIVIAAATMVVAGCRKSTSVSGIVEAGTAPTDPTGFTLGTVDHDSAQFSWTDSTDETSYEIQRCTGASCTSFTTLAASPLSANTTTFTDSTVAASTTYNYRIRAVNSVGNSNYLTSGDVTTTATPGVTYACTSPNTTIIDYGVKGNAAGVARGIYSDVKYVPDDNTGGVITPSSYVGTVYFDVGALAVKFSYWDGSTFTSEVISGDSAANVTYLRLAYLSVGSDLGKPIVFWTNGTANSGQIMMAVRSAASPAAGTWTVTAIDSSGGAVNRAMEVSVSPIDQVAISYQSSTVPAANAIRFIYCSSGCTSASNYVAMANTAQLNTTAGVATQIKLGMQWCQVSSGIYNPVVSYGSTTNARYAICQSGTNTLTSCTTAAGWTERIFTGTPNTVVSSDIIIDPQIVSDPIKGWAKDATNIKFYKAATGCGAAPATLTAGAGFAIGSAVAATANSFYKTLKHTSATSTSERYSLMINDGTTAVKWFNSTTDDFSAAWNTSGTLQTVTLGTAGATGGGADINNQTGQLITAYGTAAATFNVTLGVIDNYLTASSTTQVTFNTPVDLNGHTQLNAAQQNNVALAVTDTNKPAVAYVDFSAGANTTGRLKYALRTSSAFTGSSWPVITVPLTAAASSPQYPSLAFDHNNKPWIGYYDANTNRFMLATNTSSDGTGAWTTYFFPNSAGAHGAAGAQPMANTTAVAMSYVSGVASPVLIITDNGTTKQIKSAKLNTTTGLWNNLTQVVALSASGASFLSADFSTTSNSIVIAYNDLTATRVKYSQSSDAGATWLTPANISHAATSVGVGTRIKLNPVTGKPAISYHDRLNARLYYAYCANAPASCSTGWSGTGTAVLNGLGIQGLATTNDNLLQTGLTFSVDGDAYINYVSGVLDVGAIRMIDNVGGTMPSGLPSTLVAGKNGALTGAAVVNGGVPWGLQSERFSNGVLGMAYTAPGNSLGFTSCGD